MSVKTFLSSGPLDYATVVMRDFCGAQGGHGSIFDEGEALRMAALSADFPMNLEDPAAYGYEDPAPGAAYPATQPMAVSPTCQQGDHARCPSCACPCHAGGPQVEQYADPYGAAQPAFGQSPGGFAPIPANPQGARSPYGQPGGSPPAPAWNDPWAQPPPGQADPYAAAYAAPAGYDQPFDYSAPAAPPRPAKRKAPPPDPSTPHPFDLLSSGGGAGAGAPSPPVPPFQPSPFQAPAAPSPFARQPPLPPDRGGGASPFGTRSPGGTEPGPFPDLLNPPAPTPQSRNADPWNGQQAPGWGTPQPAPEPGPVLWPDTLDPLNSGVTSGGGMRGNNPAPAGRRGMYPGGEDPQQSGGRKSGRSRGISLPFSNPFGGKGLGRRDFIPTPDRDFARRMIERGPTIVVMGSRKGGVGKTSYAAGVAIVAGQVLDTAGHKAAIVDANIANPDAWGQMNLREGAATVREVVAALTGNRQPPEPVHAQTPALACYPESRETTEYSKTDVRRLADFLRRRYTFIVVDMSNRLPDPMAGPEAAAAAYWLEQADVLVLPTTSSKTDFNGVLDYLDVRNLPPCVVPYIVPKVKKNREHEVTQAYLDEIRTRVHRIIDIPDEADKVRYAGMEGVPVEQVSPSLGLAYRELTEAVVAMPPRERSAGA